jgi:hypothetical protein
MKLSKCETIVDIKKFLEITELRAKNQNQIFNLERERLNKYKTIVDNTKDNIL